MIEKKVLWMAVATGATALAGAAVNRGLDQAWRVTMKDDPPEDPTSSSVSWRDAIVWTVATSVVIGLGRLLARRGVAAGWQAMMGEDPPD